MFQKSNILSYSGCEDTVTISNTTFKRLVDESIELIKAKKEIEQLKHKLSKKACEKSKNEENATREDDVSSILQFSFMLVHNKVRQ